MQPLSTMRGFRIHIDAGLDLDGGERRTRPAALVAALLLSGLMAVASLGGICFAPTYSRESANWAAQAIGQDWFDLVFAVPWLVVTAVLSLRGSRRALLLLCGGVAYTLYEFVIYAFALRFNALFLIYCAALGLSFFSLWAIAELIRGDPRKMRPPPAWVSNAAAYFLIASGLLFYFAWLGEIVPALLHGAEPQSVRDAGVATNPVHVMDLSIVLPIHIAAGVLLLRRRDVALLLAPVVLAFDVIMAASIAAMMLVMSMRGVAANRGVVLAMACVAAMSTVLLERMLRAPRTARGARAG
jgi:hypothetical protein